MHLTFLVVLIILRFSVFIACGFRLFRIALIFQQLFLLRSDLFIAFLTLVRVLLVIAIIILWLEMLINKEYAFVLST